MNKFTIEDLRDIAYRGSYDDLEHELALQLLASMEQTPVYLRPFGDDGETFVACDGDDERAIPLYAAPQLPQPAVPGEIQKLKDGRGFKYVKDGVHYSVNYANGWNQCRAAMLQGAEPVSQPHTLREGVAAIRNSGIAIDAEKIQAERDALNEPDVPDGYALVPVEPTEKMVIEGFESVPHQLFQPADWDKYQAMSGCEQAAHRAKLCWAAMIKAAAKP